MSLVLPSCTESAPRFGGNEFVEDDVVWLISFAFCIGGNGLGFVILIRFSLLMLAGDEGLDCGADSSVLFVWRAL